MEKTIFGGVFLVYEDLELVEKKFFSDGEFYDLSDWDFSGIFGLHSLQQTSILPFFKT